MVEDNGNIQWHLSWGGQTYGPFDLETIKGKVASGELDLKLSHAWRPGYEGWKPCLEVGELAGLQNLTPPPPPPPPGMGKALSTGIVMEREEEEKDGTGEGKDPEPFPAVGQENRWTKDLEPLWAIPLTFDFGQIFRFSGDVAFVEDCGKYGIIGRAGEWVVHPLFDEADDFSEGLARVKLDGKWGYIDRKGSWVVRPAFDEADDFSEGLATVELDGKWGVIDRKGEWVLPPTFEDLTDYYGGLARVKLDGKCGFIDRKGEWVLPPTFEDSTDYFGGLARVVLEGKWGFIDRKGEWAIPPAFEGAGVFSEGLAPVELDGKWGYIDRTGSWVVRPAFDKADDFSEGLARVVLDGKWGVIDSKGSWVVRPAFDWIGVSSEGLVPVCLVGQWGVLNLSEFEPADVQTGEEAPLLDALGTVLKQYDEKSGFHLSEKFEDWEDDLLSRSFDLEWDRKLLAFVGDPGEAYKSGIVFTDTYVCTRGPKGNTRMEYEEWSKGKMDQVRSMVARTEEDPAGRFWDGEFWRLFLRMLEACRG